MKSWAECYRDPEGTIYADETLSRSVESGVLVVRWLVVRGPFSLLAYVGVPSDYPQAGWSFDLVPLEVHGGLTFAGLGEGAPRPTGWWWYGWDYGHAFDATWIRWEMRDRGVSLPDWPREFPPEREWGVVPVRAEAAQAAERMMELALAHWTPAPEAAVEQDESERRLESLAANMASGKAMDNLAASIAKMRRLRELDGREAP